MKFLAKVLGTFPTQTKLYTNGLHRFWECFRLGRNFQHFFFTLELRNQVFDVTNSKYALKIVEQCFQIRKSFQAIRKKNLKLF